MQVSVDLLQHSLLCQEFLTHSNLVLSVHFVWSIIWACKWRTHSNSPNIYMCGIHQCFWNIGWFVLCYMMLTHFECEGRHCFPERRDYFGAWRSPTWSFKEGSRQTQWLSKNHVSSWAAKITFDTVSQS